jgi:hypothetical protein
MVLILPDNSISFVVCEEHTNTKEEVCSTESFHNQFIVRPRDTHKNLKIQTKGWEALGGFISSQTRGLNTNQQPTRGVYKGENMEVTWKSFTETIYW